jgi:hypothetical protein
MPAQREALKPVWCNGMDSLQDIEVGSEPPLELPFEEHSRRDQRGS